MTNAEINEETDESGSEIDFDGEISSDDDSEDSPQLNGALSESYDENGEIGQEDERMDVDEPAPEFKVLGVQEFVEKKDLSSIPDWAAKPTTFSAKIASRSGAGIAAFDGLDARLFDALKAEISVWFPVQTAVLPMLLAPPSLLPPRDVAISAPTGSGKTLCYLIPVLNHLFAHSTAASKLFALIEFAKYNVGGANIVVLNETRSYEQERRLLFADGSKRTRANHLTDDCGRIDLSDLRFLVVDEADSMRFVREEWLELVERLANYPLLHTMSYGSLVAFDKNTRLQKILVSATLSLEADKLHVWNLRCPRLFRATVSSVVEKREAAEDAGAEAVEAKRPKVNGAKRDVRPTDDAARLTLPAGLQHEVKICKEELKPLFVYSYLVKNPEWKRTLVFVNNLVDSKRLFILLQHLLGADRCVLEISTNLFGNRRLKMMKKLTNPEGPSEEKLLVKKDLMSVGIYDEVVENRERDEEFVEEHRPKFRDALNALKQRLEAAKHTDRRKKKK
ncbi:putative ATP-dependent RNA helicase [Aphelenchoides fujianensis]|nr:putative ATP-dependent RNA helicase [Aphelenchoides fujianensis]